LISEASIRCKYIKYSKVKSVSINFIVRVDWK
jgi:hypothetical protein